MCQVTKSPDLTSLTPCSRALCAFQDRQDFAGALEQSGLDALPVATNNACGYQGDLNQVLRVQVRHLTTEPGLLKLKYCGSLLKWHGGIHGYTCREVYCVV